MPCFSRFRGSDVAVLAFQGGGFSASIIKGVAARCIYDFPQVLFCGALKNMKPFPTSFWLVCPFLARILGGLESAGGVGEMERAAAGLGKDWLRYDLLHARVRLSTLTGAQRVYLSRMRRNLFRAICRGGVGGSVSSRGLPRVKCLHLQMASYLGLGWHPMSEWLDGKVGKLACDGAMCASLGETLQ